MPAIFHPRHPAVVRVTHWLITLSFLALLVTGVEILISHPRFYWGEIGNVNTHPLFTLPIPVAQRYGGYRLWLCSSRPERLEPLSSFRGCLGCSADWLTVLHLRVLQEDLRRNLLPAPSDLSPSSLADDVARHLRFGRPSDDDAWSYNVLQRLTYLLVIFVLFPLVIWTGLAMSPAIEGAFPALVTVLGGRQSARTIHFFVSIFLVLFLLIHVLMVYLAGFRNRVGAMIFGRLTKSTERL